MLRCRGAPQRHLTTSCRHVLRAGVYRHPYATVVQRNWKVYSGSTILGKGVDKPTQVQLPQRCATLSGCQGLEAYLIQNLQRPGTCLRQRAAVDCLDGPVKGDQCKCGGGHCPRAVHCGHEPIMLAIVGKPAAGVHCKTVLLAWNTDAQPAKKHPIHSNRISCPALIYVLELK